MNGTVKECMRAAISKILETSDAERGGDDGGLVYEELARDMTEAAMLVYNACLRGQQFADSQ
jgi:hypothetical protein